MGAIQSVDGRPVKRSPLRRMFLPQGPNNIATVQLEWSSVVLLRLNMANRYSTIQRTTALYFPKTVKIHQNRCPPHRRSFLNPDCRVGAINTNATNTLTVQFQQFATAPKTATGSSNQESPLLLRTPYLLSAHSTADLEQVPIPDNNAPCILAQDTGALFDHASLPYDNGSCSYEALDPCAWEHYRVTPDCDISIQDCAVADDGTFLYLAWGRFGCFCCCLCHGGVANGYTAVVYAAVSRRSARDLARLGRALEKSQPFFVCGGYFSKLACVCLGVEVVYVFCT